ncbi:MAG: hypothetical protein HYW26_00925 [Candidatus Aenigmarchaeota archaeon]|nr:hypothetical protein [Candidatus Aenigmarchaeota archaeon]
MAKRRLPSAARQRAAVQRQRLALERQKRRLALARQRQRLSSQYETEEKRASSGRRVFIAGLALILVIIFLYFFVMYPAFVAKPSVDRFPLAAASDIDSEHINWLINEAGGYKLHPDWYFFGERPEIETVITDQGRRFTTTIINGYPVTVEAPAKNPDIRFRISSGDFLLLYASPDILKTAQAMRNEGTLRVDLLKSEFALTVKGYRVIYDKLPSP